MELRVGFDVLGVGCFVWGGLVYGYWVSCCVFLDVCVWLFGCLVYGFCWVDLVIVMCLVGVVIKLVWVIYSLFRVVGLGFVGFVDCFWGLFVSGD